MPNLQIYDTVDDYQNNIQTSSFLLNTTLSDLKRHASTLGNLSGYSISSSGETFYNSFVDMFFDSTLKVSDDYLKTETSLISSFSFLMGMILTKEVAEKKYDIKNLYHLKDTTVKYKTLKGEKHPDFYGVDSASRPYLFEAKGRKKSMLGKTKKIPGEKSEIEKIKDQLLNINILDNTGKILYVNKDIHKHIIFSRFYPNLEIYDIDPPSENNGRDTNALMLDEAFLLKDYYKNIANLIEMEENIIRSINKKEYIVVKKGESYIGLEKKIYDNISNLELEPSNFSQNEELLEKHREIVNENNLLSTEKVSIGFDGIIYSEDFKIFED